MAATETIVLNISLMAQTLRADMALRDSRHSDFRLEKSFDTSALFLRPSLISRILYPIAEPNSLRGTWSSRGGAGSAWYSCQVGACSVDKKASPV